MTLEWTPNYISWKLDGREFAIVTDKTKIPKTPMRLAMQLESGNCTFNPNFCSATPSTGWGSLQIDSINIQKYAGTA